VRSKGASSLFLRAAVTASAVAIAFVAFGTAAASASTEGATINTYPAWDGSSEVVDFGCPNTTTYGQTITVPEGKTSLKKFTFSWINLNSGSMLVRAEVYAWDGAKATGSSLFEKKRKITLSDGAFHNETFKTKGVPVTPGSQYVLFASIDKDFEKCTDNYVLGWGLVNTGDPYPGGGFVYQNNTGDESQWTLTPWSSFGGEDVAFKASLS
jgi:hypothetical protein